MNPTTSHDVLVIGAGIAGLAAARESLRAGLSTAYLEADVFGGLILNVNELDGAVRGSGAEFASQLVEQVTELGGESLDGRARGIEADGSALFVDSDAGRHRARAVIVASGAARRKLGVPGEAELEHKGVSHCADCDGPMYQGQQVVVVGGGDSAVQSALVLANYCSRVVLVHRGSALTAKPHLVKALQAAPNVTVRLESIVSEVLGSEGVEAVCIGDERVPCTGFFAYVGLEPVSGFLPQQVRRDAAGAVITSAQRETALPGVYAAGAVRAGCGGMVEDAVADGIAAARAAVARLRSSPGAAA